MYATWTSADRPAERRGQRALNLGTKVGSKRKWVAAAALLTTAAAAALAAGPAGAYQTFNDHKLTYGVSGQKYWLSASAVDKTRPQSSAV
jgi:hypothetical protein